MNPSTHVVAPRLPLATAAQIMHPGVVSCGPAIELRDVARIMAEHSIHFVVVDGVEPASDGGERFVWSAVSDLDLIRAIADPAAATAGELAATELVSVDTGDSLEQVAQRLSEHEVSHALVVDPSTRRPTGVVSTLDLARALAGDG
jgi:CBS domain-containing protein